MVKLRGIGNKVYIANSQQRIPLQWKKYLSNGENKKELTEFLFIHWTNARPEFDLYIACGGLWHSVLILKDVITKILELHCDNEEADTRL